jgi:hypothetical protein
LLPGVILDLKQKEETEMGKIKDTLFVVVLLIFGCAGIKTGQQMALFDETSRAYDRAIRWGEYEEAYA